MHKLKRSISFLLIAIMLLVPLTTMITSAQVVNDGDVTIETTLKNMTTKADKLTFDLWAKDSKGEKISASNVKVTNNDKPVAINWDDLEKTSYTLNLELESNHIKINVNYDGETYLQEFFISREEAEDGDVIGQFIFSLEAPTIGLGYLIKPIEVDILKGENAAQALDRLITEHKYEYDKTGSLTSSFYLAIVYGGENEIYKEKPIIPDELKEALNGNYDENAYSEEYGLGEFDFNSMSGWMYAVNNVFPNVGFADKYLQQDDVMRVQYTLAYGNDIGGADALGGGYENNMFPIVNRDDLTRKIAKINSSNKREKYLAIDEVKEAYNKSINDLLTIGITQDELDESLSDLEKALDVKEKIVTSSIEKIEGIEVNFATSKEDAISKLPSEIELNLSNDTTEKVEVTWTSKEYDGNISGEYIFVGNYDLPEGVAGDKVDVNAKVTVEDKESDFEFDKERGTIREYIGDGGDIVIPREIDGVPVKKIWYSAFRKKGLTSVVIPDSVKTLDKLSFSYNSLTNVKIPDSVTTVGSKAFINNKLESVTLPKELKEIQDGVFKKNEFTSFTIPENIISIEEDAFEDNKLESLKIPDNVEKIGAAAFRGNKLTSLTIPKTIKEIGRFAFADNKLNSLEILNGIESIDVAVFLGNQLSSVEIPESVKKLEKWVFLDNPLEENSVIIDNFKENIIIGDRVFENSLEKDITPIFLKDEEEKLAINKIELLKGGKVIGESEIVENEITIQLGDDFPEDELDYIGFGQYTLKIFASENAEVIQEGGTRGNWEEGKLNLIGIDEPTKFTVKAYGLEKDYILTIKAPECEFINIKDIKDVENIKVGYATSKEDATSKLPSEIELNLNNKTTKKVKVTWTSKEYDGNISGDYIFVGNYDLPEGITGDKLDVNVKVTVKGEESDFKFDKETGTITGYNGEGGNVVIPREIDGVPVKIIGSHVFNRKKLTSVIIPDSVTTLGKLSFCYNPLTKVEIPDSVTTIESRAFLNNKLESVTLPKNLTEITSSAFYGNELTSIVLPESVKKIDERAFERNNLTSIIIPKSVESIEDSSFRTNQLTSIIIPDNVKGIGMFAFAENKIASLQISEGIERIKRGTFSENQLSSIEIPENVTNIDSRAFEKNPLIKDSVKISNFEKSVNIGEDAFKNNSKENIRPIFLKDEEEKLAINKIELLKGGKVIGESEIVENEITIQLGDDFPEDELDSIGFGQYKLKVFASENAEVIQEGGTSGNWEEGKLNMIGVGEPTKFTVKAYGLEKDYIVTIKSPKYEYINIKDIKDVENIEVDFATSKEDVISKLPSEIELNLNNDTTENVEVTWTSKSYNGEISDEYIFTGDYDLPEGVTGEKLGISVKVTVKEYEEGPVEPEEPIEPVDPEEPIEPVDPEEPIEPIEPEVNKEELESKIKEASKIDLENKTEESVKTLTDAIVKGEGLLGKEGATQEEINNLIKEIDQAVANLEDKKDEEKPVEPEKPEEDTEDEKDEIKPEIEDSKDKKEPKDPEISVDKDKIEESKKNELPKTGVNSNNLLNIIGIILIGIGFSLWYRKKQIKA